MDENFEYHIDLVKENRPGHIVLKTMILMTHTAALIPWIVEGDTCDYWKRKVIVLHGIPGFYGIIAMSLTMSALNRDLPHSWEMAFNVVGGFLCLFTSIFLEMHRPPSISTVPSVMVALSSMILFYDLMVHFASYERHN